MSRNKLPKYFDKWSGVWDQWSSVLKKNNLNPAEVCLSYPFSLPEIDHIIVGVNSAYQLNDIINKSQSQFPEIDLSFMISSDQKLINPTNWNNL